MQTFNHVSEHCGIGIDIDIDNDIDIGFETEPFLCITTGVQWWF